MNPDKTKVLEEVLRSRAAIARDILAVGDELNLMRKAELLFQTRPGFWLGGAAVLGWLIAGPKRKTVRIPTRGGGERNGTKPVKRSPGLLFSLVKMSLPILKPALTAYAAKRVSEFAKKVGG